MLGIFERWPMSKANLALLGQLVSSAGISRQEDAGHKVLPKPCALSADDWATLIWVGN
jgi:hypothetical protein